MEYNRQTWFDKLQEKYLTYIQQKEALLFEYFKQHEDALKPRLSANQLAAFMIAFAVQSFTILLVILAVVILISQFASQFSICYSVLLVGLAFLLRPRFGKLPEAILPAKQYPNLYGFADKIADQLRAPRVDLITFNDSFDTSYTRVGIRQSRLLTLSHPLWMNLTPSQQVALVSHELAQAINGDPARTFVVSTAIRSLEEWYWIYPPTKRKLRYSRGTVGHPIFYIIVIHYLLLFESRRAEYLTDRLAASISGTEAMIALLRKMQKSYSITFPIATHPPIENRIAMLEGHPIQQPTAIFTESDMASINAEISSLNNLIMERSEQQGHNDY
jgi:Zn-dependent protease with chaperone function